jgi:hypothetical protein
MNSTSATKCPFCNCKCPTNRGLRNHFAKSKPGKCGDFYAEYLQYKGYDVGRWMIGCRTPDGQKGWNWCLNLLPTPQQAGNYLTARNEISTP